MQSVHLFQELRSGVGRGDETGCPVHKASSWTLNILQLVKNGAIYITHQCITREFTRDLVASLGNYCLIWPICVDCA